MGKTKNGTLEGMGFMVPMGVVIMTTLGMSSQGNLHSSFSIASYRSRVALFLKKNQNLLNQVSQEMHSGWGYYYRSQRYGE